VIQWQELVPASIRQMLFDRQVQASLRQLGGEGQSHGMNI